VSVATATALATAVRHCRDRDERFAPGVAGPDVVGVIGASFWLGCDRR